MDARLRQIADKLMKFKSAKDVHPRSVGAALLPHLFILGIEKHNNAPRLRVRLIGTSLQQFFGRSLRDRYMEDFIHGPRAAEVIAGFHKVALSHSPLWMRQLVQVSNRVPRFVEGVVVYLPLLDSMAVWSRANSQPILVSVVQQPRFSRAEY